MSYDIKNLKTSIKDMELDSPLVIASGVWPYDKKMWGKDFLGGIGAACTKAVTAEPREGNSGIRVWETPSGMLNSIGLQNSGVDTFIKDHLQTLSSSTVPFVVNVAAESENEIELTLKKLEAFREIVPCVELNISCPNVDEGGMLWGKTPQGASRAVEIARKSWTGPLWVKLTPQASDICEVGMAAQEAGADALVASNTWLGMDIDINKKEPVFRRTFAGLSGPAIFPMALRVVWELCSAVSVPVIGCGGVHTSRDCIAMIMAGAAAVEIGTALFSDLSCPDRICRGLMEYLEANGIDGLDGIRGAARK